MSPLGLLFFRPNNPISSVTPYKTCTLDPLPASLPVFGHTSASNVLLVVSGPKSNTHFGSPWNCPLSSVLLSPGTWLFLLSTHGSYLAQKQSRIQASFLQHTVVITVTLCTCLSPNHSSRMQEAFLHLFLQPKGMGTQARSLMAMLAGSGDQEGLTSCQAHTALQKRA